MISFFDHPHHGTMAEIAARLGGKGASLWAMTTQLGLPVPPGFTIGTEHSATGLTDALFADVLAAVETIGAHVGQTFGDPVNPLLVSVRSGAAVSMPGMMDTVLNVGMTEDVRAHCDDAGFADALHRTFLDQFVAAAPGFDHAMLNDAPAVLRAAIEAVFASWHSPRAIAYRAREGLSDRIGTAVTVQAMVFGNRDARSGTGVVFSRDPSTGVPGMTGDWLAQAQGEAVVAGTHDPLPVSALVASDRQSYDALVSAMAALENYYRDMVDVEFTIERGTLWILQARVGKRSAAAAARIAHDLVTEGQLTQREARARLPHSLFDGSVISSRSDADHPVIATGLGVSPGLVSGRVALDCDAAIDLADAGEPVILVRTETSPEDVHGMGVSVGILTTTGGAMSHAALVAREWGIAAVCGADIALYGDGFRAAKHHVAAGDMISIDGRTGEVFLGHVTAIPVTDPYVETVRTWAMAVDQQEKHYGQA
jgi:pyruvate, orthophosphate dikinase